MGWQQLFCPTILANWRKPIFAVSLHNLPMASILQNVTSHISRVVCSQHLWASVCPLDAWLRVFQPGKSTCINWTSKGKFRICLYDAFFQMVLQIDWLLVLKWELKLDDQLVLLHSFEHLSIEGQILIEIPKSNSHQNSLVKFLWIFFSYSTAYQSLIHFKVPLQGYIMVFL